MKPFCMNSFSKDEWTLVNVKFLPSAFWMIRNTRIPAEVIYSNLAQSISAPTGILVVFIFSHAVKSCGVVRLSNLPPMDALKILFSRA